MSVVGLLDGVHDEVASLDETSEEDECLGTGECGKVAACLAEHLAGELEYLVGNLVAFAGGNAHVEGCDVLVLEVAQE